MGIAALNPSYPVEAKFHRPQGRLPHSHFFHLKRKYGSTAASTIENSA